MSAPWCVLKDDKFACERCGDTLSIALPMPVSLFAKKATAFEALHEDCEGYP